jgi:hypothetical protein
MGINDPRFVRSIISATNDPTPIHAVVVDSAVTPEVPHHMSHRDPRKPWLRQELKICTPEVLPNPIQPTPNTFIMQQHFPTNDLNQTDLPVTFKMMTISNK